MKKLLSILLVLALTLASFTVLTSYAGGRTLVFGEKGRALLCPGDADGDGEVTDWDAIMLERYLAGWNIEIVLDSLDFDGDGEISDWDAIILNRYLAGWNVSIDTGTAEPTAEPTNEPTAEPTAAPSSGHVNGYGSETVYIDKNAAPQDGYFFSTLTESNKISFYRDLEAMALAYGNVVYPTVQINIDDAVNVYHLFILDHPELFWLGNSIGYSYSDDGLISLSIQRIVSLEETPEKQSQIDAVVSDIIDLIPDDASDFEAELIIVKWLAANVDYVINDGNCYNLYGCLVERACVCEGFSEAFQYISQKIGIPSFSVSGVAIDENGEQSHKWPVAMIGGKWYQLEPTWVSLETNRWVIYINDNSFISGDHVPAADTAPLLPDFSSMDAAYLRYYGFYADTLESSDSPYSLYNSLTRSVAHFKTVLTDEKDYNCALLKLAPGVSADDCISALLSDSPDIQAALDEAAAGDGYSYAIYAAEKEDENTVVIWFYRFEPYY